MPERDSNQSSGHTDTGDSIITPAFATPFSIKGIIHRFFIPSILVIVSAIVLNASLYSNNLDSPTAGVPQDQGDELAFSDEEEAVAVADANDRPGARVETQPKQKTAMTRTASMTSANAPSGHQQPYRGRGFGRAYLYGQPIPYARPEYYYPPVYSGVLDQRHKVYYQTAQAREQHWKQIRANRAAVLKRIEQNRENIYRRMQEIEQQKLNRTNERLIRLEQKGALAGYYPT